MNQEAIAAGSAAENGSTAQVVTAIAPAPRKKMTLSEVREKLDNPNFLCQSERLIKHTDVAQNKLAAFIERRKKMLERRALAAR